MRTGIGICHPVQMVLVQAAALAAVSRDLHAAPASSVKRKSSGFVSYALDKANHPQFGNKGVLLLLN